MLDMTTSMYQDEQLGKMAQLLLDPNDLQTSHTICCIIARWLGVNLKHAVGAIVRCAHHPIPSPRPTPHVR